MQILFTEPEVIRLLVDLDTSREELLPSGHAMTMQLLVEQVDVRKHELPVHIAISVD